MNEFSINIFTARFLSFFTGLIFLFFVPHLIQAKDSVSSQTTNPESVIGIAIEDVLAQLKANEDLYRSDPEMLRRLVAKSALSSFNVMRMSQLAMAKHWRRASKQQREIFVQEFQRYLIRSYTNTLFSYRDAKPQILGSSDNGKGKSDNKTILKIRVKNDRNQDVTLFLRLEFDGDSWKIIDINVEGVSLIVTIRSAFDGEIEKIGIDAFLINLIDQNNKAMQN